MVSLQKVFATKLDTHAVSSPISRTDSTMTHLTSDEKSPLSSLENSPVNIITHFFFLNLS